MDHESPDDHKTGQAATSPTCPACGGRLIEIRAKFQFSRYHTMCEMSYEGGRG